MSRFYVGQRVRIVFSLVPWEFGHLVGLEGSVMSIDEDRLSGCKYALDIDGFGSRDQFGNSYWYRPEQLEPAADSNSVVSWSECAWKPHHLRDEVPA